MFIKFRNTYEQTSSKVTLLLQATSKAEETFLEAQQFEIEALDEVDDCTLLEVAEQRDCEMVNPDNELMVECVEEHKEISHKTNEFVCEVCSKRYQYLNSLTRHTRTAHERLRHSCPLCSQDFTQKTSLVEHIRNIHIDRAKPYSCDLCGRTFNTIKMLNQHMKQYCSDRKEKKTSTNIPKPKTKYRKQCSTCGLFFKHIEEHKLSHQSQLNLRKSEFLINIFIR